jgi:RHS repeat-associated protein
MKRAIYIYLRNVGHRTVFMAFMSCALTLFSVSTAYTAALSCNPQGYASIIGTEVVAVQCIPEGMTDTTAIYYRYRDYECINGVVTKTLEGNTVLVSPNGIMYPPTGMGSYFRHFRNKEGSYFFDVSTWYRGTIDGKSMSPSVYVGGGVYTDVFTKLIEESLIPPKCKKTPECNSCPCPTAPVGSTADLSTGALSHSQELLALKGGQLPLSITLDYTSDPFAPSAIGNGWSHSYEQSLQILSNGSVKFWNEGKVHDYRLFGGVFTAPVGTYSTLVKNGNGSYTLTEKDGLIRNFDSTGRITSLVDRNGNSTLFTYTSAGLTGVTDPGGRSATFSYDGAGKLATISDPMNNIFSFNYSGGLLTGISTPDGGTWNYTYTAGGKLSTKTDPGNYSTTYAYDINNRVTSGTDPQSQTRSIDYVSGGVATRSAGKVPDPYRRCDNVGTIDPNNPIKGGSCEQTVVPVTEKNGAGWKYEYEYTSNTLKSKTDPYNNKTTYIHDAIGQMLAKTEPGIGTTWYTYDSKGNTLTIKNPLNQITSYTYNTLGQILTTSGPQGNSSYSYDTKGNMLTSTDPAGAITTYEYDIRGNVTKITNARNQITTMTYTGAGLLETSTDPTGVITAYTYDARGNMLTTTVPDGTTTYEYDTMNRLTKITDPLGTITSYGYDTSGNRTSQTDANGNVTTYKHNFQGHVTETKDALNKLTTFSYGNSSCPTCNGGVDKLTALTDARQQTTSYDYDLTSRLAKETDPLNKNTTYAYDAAGNMTSKTDANGTIITYTYDALKRLTGKIYPDAGSETYSYDAAGRILTATNRDISYTYSYNAAGRMISVTDTSGNTLDYEYDILGTRTKATLFKGTADEHVTSYGYDSANRPLTITGTAGTFSYGYNPSNRRASLVYPNQITTSYTYDAVGRVTALNHPGIASFSYSHDNIGNRTSKTASETELYLYDLIYRLTNVTNLQKPESFLYDDVGNRTMGPGANDSGYSYYAGNQITQGRKLGYSYDSNGNQTTKAQAGITDKTWTQTWDYENRLVKVEKAKGAENRTVTFKYDPFGRRIEKQLTTIIDSITKTATWKYVYDGDNIAVEIYTNDAGVTEKTWYTHGANIDEHLAIERNGQYFYYHADGLGSVTIITDTGRNTVQTYQYDSFGMMKPTTVFRNSYTYTGREWDKETGLYYYRARYYDPMEGRFISKDPIGFKGGDVNIYGYTKNNPINFVDPNGLNTVAIWHAACTKQPTAKTRCECHCIYTSDYDGCMKTCMDCFSSKKPLSPKELCKCICKQAGLDNCDCVCSGVK